MEHTNPETSAAVLLLKWLNGHCVIVMQALSLLLVHEALKYIYKTDMMAWCLFSHLPPTADAPGLIFHPLMAPIAASSFPLW